MEILNINVTAWFKFFGFIQVGLLLLLFLVIVAFIFYQERSLKVKTVRNEKISKLLLNFNQISVDERQFLKKYLPATLEIFYQLEKNGQIPQHADCVLILNNLFLPPLKSYVDAKEWYFRQMAALILQLKGKYLVDANQDRLWLQKLLSDDTPLVVINAAIAICYQPTPTLVNLLIDTFAFERRSQYELLRLILSEAALQIAPMVVERLNRETHLQVKSLCYRMLTDLPPLELHVPSLKEDILSEDLDVCLAAVAYIAYSKHRDYKGLLVKLLSHSAWQVRARAAKLIGRIQDPNLSIHLEPMLSDKLWWVRFRAAEALLLLSDEGMMILNRQTNPDAKEIAQQQIKLQQLRLGK